MAEPDGFHPDFPNEAVQRPPRNQVRHVKSTELDATTAQTEGMQRFAALSASTVGSEKLWMGRRWRCLARFRPTTITATPRP